MPKEQLNALLADKKKLTDVLTYHVVAGKVMAKAHDARQGDADPLAHAEWLALRQAAAHQRDWRLDEATLVVTLEPCPMCAGAILMSRVSRIVFGAANPKWGAAGSRAVDAAALPGRAISGGRRCVARQVLHKDRRKLGLGHG